MAKVVITNISKVPKVRTEHKVYEFGSSRKKSKYTITIVKVLRRWRAPHRLRRLWRQTSQMCRGRYCYTTDFFVKAYLHHPRAVEKVYFVRGADGSWQSLPHRGCVYSCNLAFDLR